MTIHAIEKAVSILGSQAGLGRAIGADRAMVYQWLHGRRPVAAEWCPKIERATGGRVRCEDLLPGVDWAYLRGTNCEHREAA